MTRNNSVILITDDVATPDELVLLAQENARNDRMNVTATVKKVKGLRP